MNFDTKYYPNPIDMSIVLGNLRTANRSFAPSRSSDRTLGLSFRKVNGFIKARELIQRIIRLHDDSSYNPLNSYKPRTYKNKDGNHIVSASEKG